MKQSQMMRLLDYINHVTSTGAHDLRTISALQHELINNAEPDTLPPRYAGATPVDYPKMPAASCGVVPRHNRWLYKWIPHPQHMVSVRYKDAGYWYIYVAEYPRTFFARLDTESAAKLICEAVNGFNENRGHAVDYKGEYERLYNSVRELQALVGSPEVFAVDMNSLLRRIRELVKP